MQVASATVIEELVFEILWFLVGGKLIVKWNLNWFKN